MRRTLALRVPLVRTRPLASRSIGRLRREGGRLVLAGHALVADPSSAAPVVQMEPNVLRLGGRVQPHRNVHETEADGSGPDRLWHARKVPPGRADPWWLSPGGPRHPHA